MDTIKITDIQKIATKQGYKHAGLYNHAGSCIIAMNSNKVPLKTRIKEITERLSILGQGFYTVRFQYQLGKKFEVCDYVVQIGNPTLSEIIPPPVNQNQNQPQQIDQVRGWNEALKDKEELAMLKAENARIKKELEQANAELADNGDDDEKDNDGKLLSDSQTNALKEIVPQFTPLFDRIMDYKNKQLELKERELNLRESGRYAPINPASIKLKSVHPWRPLPDMNDQATFTKYCEWLEKTDDTTFDGEFNYVEKTNPQMLQVLLQLFPQDGTKTA